MSLSALTIRPSFVKPTFVPPPCSPNTLKVPGNFDSASIAMPAAAPGGPKSARARVDDLVGSFQLVRDDLDASLFEQALLKRDAVGCGLHDRQPHRDDFLHA